MMNDKLINKDIQKVSVIVDTDDLSYTGADQSRSNFNYNIKFDENGFGGVFNNVIGFRLKKAILRNNPILIDETNSTIDAGTPKYLLKTKYGYYTGSSWKDLLNDSSAWTTNSDGISSPFSNIGAGAVTYDTATNKLTFPGNPDFDFTNHKASARLLGFNPGTNPAATGISPFPIDLSNHYVDVVVPEIPSIACKRTATGKNVIERIPLNSATGTIQYFICDPSDLQSTNYFYPIKLSEITIQLYTDNNNLLSATNEQSSFEFEITMLKNNTFR